MPICEADPWRLQYFEGISCPESVKIPTEDGDAWAWFPLHKWVYNKLTIAETQGFPCGPHGLDPSLFPIFSKPIYNMRGMGAGTRILRSLKEYKHYQRPGHMWMPLLEGDHISTDVAVVHGTPKWWRHAMGKSLKGGMFDYWTILAQSDPDIEAYCGDWLSRHLPTYTGMVNFETIGAKIIEVHLRFADQWPDLYGTDWVKALIRLYGEGSWEFDDSNRKEGFSVVLFGGHGIQYQHPPQDLLFQIRNTSNISSLQITFHEDRPPEDHSMPPGGFRLAIVNCWDLETGLEVREQLALSFWSTQQLLSTRKSKSGQLVSSRHGSSR